MKKLISLLLAMMLILTFSACGEKKNESEETKTTSSTTDDTAKETNSNYSFFDEVNYTVEQGEPYTYSDNLYSVRTTYKLKEETQRSMPAEITLDSKEIILNSTKISELTNSGWTLINGNKIDTAVKPNLSTNAIVNSPNNKKALLYAVNTTDDTINFSDCTIGNINICYDDTAVYYDGLTEAADFNYSGSISSASSLSNITDKLGEPDQITIDDYFIDENLKHSKIAIIYDVENNVRVQFEFENEGTTSKMIEVSFSHNQF